MVGHWSLEAHKASRSTRRVKRVRRVKSGRRGWILVGAVAACHVLGMVGMVGSVSAAEGETSLTIYSTAQPGAVSPELYRPSGEYRNPYQPMHVPGYAIVKQTRPVDLQGERSTIQFTDVAALIEPTTVTFESVTDPGGTHVLEQDFKFDLVSSSKLMERYIDKEISVWQAIGEDMREISGTLLSTSGGIMLRSSGGGIHMLNGYNRVVYPELPGGLITRPTLVWDVVTEKPGKHETRVTYETKGVTWWADYNIVFAEGAHANAGLLDIGAWVSIVNQSGATYEDARLKLIAGDVHRAPTAPGRAGGDMVYAARAGKMEQRLGFEEKSFFEYHLYTLGRPTTIADNATKQVELFPTSRGVPCEKVMVYYGSPAFGRFGAPLTDRNFGTQSNDDVDIYLQFKNDKESGMGMPLPSGRIRVSKLDAADASLEFIGEDVIDHTPKDEEVLIKMGSAFDVVGERKQTDFKVDYDDEWLEESFEIKVRNHKEEAVKLIVKENLHRWSNWEIKRKSHDFEKIDARTIHFPVQIPPDGEVTVTYTARYTW